MENTPSQRPSTLPLVFDEETLGLSLRELAIDVQQGETTEFLSRWFHSPQDADLFIWFDGDHRIIKTQVSYFGQVIEWNPFDGTRTGLIIEEEAAGGREEEVTEIIRFDERAQARAVEQAIRVLRHVPELAEADRARLIRNLRVSPRLHKQARERALKAWAPKADEISSNRRPTFWAQLRKWVFGR